MITDISPTGASGPNAPSHSTTLTSDLPFLYLSVCLFSVVCMSFCTGVLLSCFITAQSGLLAALSAGPSDLVAIILSSMSQLPGSRVQSSVSPM